MDRQGAGKGRRLPSMHVAIKPRTSAKLAKRDDDADPCSPSASKELKLRFARRAVEIGTKTISNVCELVLELLRELQEACTEFPVALRANWMEEVLGLPRRRIYDVLHILQAIGLVTKRVSSDGLTGHGHMFYGDYFVVPTVRSMLELQENNVPLNDAAADDKWPALSLATVKFIKFLLLNGNAIRRHLIHTIEDEKPTAAIPASKGRRMYDVLAVLVQCNIVWTNTDMGVKYIYLNRDVLNPKANFSVFRDPDAPPTAVVAPKKRARKEPPPARRTKHRPACDETLTGLFGGCQCGYAPELASPDAQWQSLLTLGASIVDAWSTRDRDCLSLECYEGVASVDDFV
ncbi:hypothetical protein SPRG_05390 [Saprolegnia parasitica CBS 223.65]|uniref:E2F/DP family winged-helix DNA-binding domain-containing protein n=1 Tax=Saprolegnia parasitica (strain CBS 223.65) TaxID=695850 RepID=A0A067CQS9_SAPPC|nr:hypothetical protein SPRG_05390 [Saprolegnia parasitica CBS 223.65]KDO29147.1 hypothetical protein SPRG_05390 [Saprolegnia parasitica CBS 223.65]|eukprot:XP_012200027.1 hypothetical protein SPRG_05390 [Saprolegnia parasitica CBS 223.65]